MDIAPLSTNGFDPDPRVGLSLPPGVIEHSTAPNRPVFADTEDPAMSEVPDLIVTDSSPQKEVRSLGTDFPDKVWP